MCVGVGVGGCFYGYTTEDERRTLCKIDDTGGTGWRRMRNKVFVFSSAHVPFASVDQTCEVRGEGEKRGHEKLFHKGS